ncbi:MAG TPA: hypothetical protein PKN96_02765 [Flavobacterium sp.]|uniref:hypothetical protein n=1 Tax=Flavobacterium sp. TaxID=239 RepID=UPI002BCFC992|nr:hypothetical protein [Flavobacterium sp.]HNP32197.1 hypothetical protein [Flavobacterium sp.]
MKKVISTFAVVAFLFSMNVNANNETPKTKKKEKAKTEKSCSAAEKKMCASGEKHACCAAKKAEEKK